MLSISRSITVDYRNTYYMRIGGAMKNINTLSPIVQDSELLAIYNSAMEQVPLPELSMRESLWNNATKASHSLDMLYDDSDGQVAIVEDKLVDNAIERNGERPLPLVSCNDRSDAIVDLMKDNYPDAFQVHADTERIEAALAKKCAKHLSFLALHNTVHGVDYAAVCRAYAGQSWLYPDAEGEVVHIDHMLVGADQRRTLLGIKMFKELLRRAEMCGLHTVEMLTREDTSYRGFTDDSLTSKLLSDIGYTIEDHGVQRIKGQGDQAERMYGVRVTRQVR